MNNRKIEKCISNAMNQAPTLNFEDLLKVPYTKMKEHDYITRQSEKQTTNHRRQLAVAFSFCFVFLLCFTGWFVQYRVPDSVITLDVNPSIEIVTNRQDHILSVKAINEDGQKILDELNNKTTDLDNLVASLIPSLVKQGYLNQDRNVIMISVENSNIKKADALSLILEKQIKDSSGLQHIEPEVLRQVFTKDKDTTELAKQYSLSVGKLKLIQRALSADKTLSIEALANMSMVELLEISNKYHINLHDMIQFDDNIYNYDKNTPTPSSREEKPSQYDDKDKTDDASWTEEKELHDVIQSKEDEDLQGEDNDKQDNSQVEDEDKKDNSKVGDDDSKDNSHVEDDDKQDNSHVEDDDKQDNSQAEDDDSKDNSQVGDVYKQDNSQVGNGDNQDNSQVGGEDKQDDSQVEEDDKIDSSQVDEDEYKNDDVQSDGSEDENDINQTDVNESNGGD